MKRFYAAIDAASALSLAERRATVLDVRAAMGDAEAAKEHIEKLQKLGQRSKQA